MSDSDPSIHLWKNVRPKPERIEVKVYMVSEYDNTEYMHS